MVLQHNVSRATVGCSAWQVCNLAACSFVNLVESPLGFLRRPLVAADGKHGADSAKLAAIVGLQG